MSSCEQEDSLTKLNTALNRSMVLMDSPIVHRTKMKSGKLIKINPKIQPPSTSRETPELVKKSILKKWKNPEDSEDLNSSAITRNDTDSVMDTEELQENHAPRPHNLEDFLKEDKVVMDSTHTTFNLTDLSDNEEMWIMDIPKTVNPRKLKGQTLLLGEKSKIRVDDERYCAVSRNNGCCLTCVFSAGRIDNPYKAVNISPTGTITVRRKLSGVSKQPMESLTDTAVPFPSNLKIRHPFFGPIYDRERTPVRTKIGKKKGTLRKEVKC